MKNFEILVTVLGVLFAGTAAAKSASETLADGLREEKALRLNASPFSNAPDFEKVIAAYTTALDSGALPKSEQRRALSQRGGLYAERGECTRAISDLNSAIELGHRSARAYALRGACHLKAQAYDAAVQDFSKAISINPKDAILRRERALVFVEMKDFRRAAADLGDAIRLLKPLESADLLVLRGDAYQQQGEHQRAIDDYVAAIRITKKSAKEIGVPSTDAQMVQLRPIYAKVADAYRALSLAPQGK